MSRVTTARAALRMLAAIGVASLAIACGGAPAAPGASEPLQVSGGQFFPGDLPGRPSADAGGDGGAPAHLAITQLAVPRTVVPGVAGQSVSGNATSDALSVGVRFADLGTGYWVVPVGAPDLLLAGQSDFSFHADLAPAVPPGNHAILAVAIGGGSGPGGGPNAGVQWQVMTCVQNILPDNGHACNPALVPPYAVVSLTWDTNFDLDLHVVTPDGHDINPKSPLGGVVDGGAAASATEPYIDRDSLGSCLDDGLRREDVIFPAAPPPGIYSIYVDPFAPCGEPAVRFTVTVYALAGTCPACTQPVVYTQTGELLAAQATGGATTGLFIHQLSF